VFGHECEAKLYKVDLSSLHCECIWTYAETIDPPTHFAQTAARYEDRLFALGDYSTGTVVVYDLESSQTFAVAPEESIVSQLEFSPDGKTLAIGYGHESSSTCCYALRLASRELVRLPGGRPFTWIDDHRVILLRDRRVLVEYDIKEESEAVLHKSYGDVSHVIAEGQAVFFAKSSEELTEIECAETGGFSGVTVARVAGRLEQLQAVAGKMILATSWRGAPGDSSRIVVLDLSGKVLAHFLYDAGYGHAYPKYGFRHSNSTTYLATTGLVGTIPVIALGTRCRESRINLREHLEHQVRETRWVSVQLDIDEKDGVYLSLLSHEGQFALFKLKSKIES